MSADLVIFDCDGVLVDSETLSMRVLREMATELGVPISEAEAAAHFHGASMAHCVEVIRERLQQPVPSEFVTEYRARCAELFRRELRPFPGIETALTRIDIPTCVASSSPLRKIRLTLGIAGLLPYFQGRIFSAYQVRRFKPDPALFLHAARHMGVAAPRCAVVEDSLPGVEAGVLAGMQVFGFVPPNGFVGTGARLKQAGAQIFHHMRELPALLSRR